MINHAPYPYNLLDDICGEPYRGILDEDQQHGLDYVIGTLTERQQDCIKRYYDGEESLEDIGRANGVTRERIRQIIAKSLRMLRHPSRKRYITHGFDIASGALRKQAEDRHREHIEWLEAEYTAKIAELQQKISNADSITDYKQATEFVKSMDTPIHELDLSVRSFNCLARAGIDTLGKICGLSYDELAKVRNVGRKSVEEIVAVVHANGFHLREEQK